MNPGDKVVCIDDDFAKCWDDPRKWFNVLPKCGVVYVVESIGFAKNGEQGIRLIGIRTPDNLAVWYPWRFRLLSEMKERNLKLEAKT
jgi:hypothetical protein